MGHGVDELLQPAVRRRELARPLLHPALKLGVHGADALVREPALRDVADDVDRAGDGAVEIAQGVGGDVEPAVAKRQVEALTPAGAQHLDVGAPFEEVALTMHELVALAAGHVAGLEAEHLGHGAVAAQHGAVAVEQADQVSDGVERRRPGAGRRRDLSTGSARLHQRPERAIELGLLALRVEEPVGRHEVRVVADRVAGDDGGVRAHDVEEEVRGEARSVVLTDRQRVVVREELVQPGFVLHEALCVLGCLQAPRSSRPVTRRALKPSARAEAVASPRNASMASGSKAPSRR